MVGAWRCGNTEFMEQLVLQQPIEEYPQLKPFYEELVFKRNRNFAEKIASFLEDDKVYFIVFGSGHAIGDRGVPELLEMKGFTVEQM